MLEPLVLPVHDPILIFALAMLVFLVAPLVLERYRLPGMIGIILVGAAIGPHGIGLLDRDETFVLLGEVGLVYLMFIAGLDIDYYRFITHPERSVTFGALSFLVPQLAGTVVGVHLLGLTLPGALLFGAIFSSHTLLAYPVVDKLGIARNDAVTTTVGGTILTDTLALLVLAVVIAAEIGELTGRFWLEVVVGLLLLFLGVWVFVPRLARWFFQSVDQASHADFLFVMSVLFGSAYLAELAGVKHIIGAFLAGLAMNRLIPDTGPLMSRIEFVGNALFIPFFLLSVGMLVDVRVVLASERTVVLALTLLVLVLSTKYLAAWLTGRVYAYTPVEVLGMFGLSIGQAAAALAIVLIGFQEGIPGFEREMINAVVLMILVISLVSPTLVARAGRAIRTTETPRLASARDRPRRILVPLSPRPRHMGALISVAMLLRGPRSAEPIYTITVIEPGERADAEIAAVEERVGDATSRAAAADVTLETRVHVGLNPAAGIGRAIVENRITSVVIGWDGARSRRQAVFGSTIDQLIRQTDRTIFVVRAHRRLETTSRLLVLLPPAIIHNAGFTDVVNDLITLADQLNASVQWVVIDGDAAAYETYITESASQPGAHTVTEIADWGNVTSTLRSDVADDDFIAAVSARQGTMGWSEELRTLPGILATEWSGNFAIVYPPAESGPTTSGYLRIE